jgi:hypothetical protein
MKTIRRLDPILIQATIAAALSFAHLHDIADAAGQGGWKAWAYPVSVDLLMVMAWKRMRSPDVASKRAPWFWFLLSLSATLDESRETPPQKPQTPVSRPLTAVPDVEGGEESVESPGPILRSYAEVGEALNVATATVRGWANVGKVKKYPGPTPSTVLVDLVECTTTKNGRVAVGG